MNIVSIFKQAPQLAYGALLSPLLAYSVKRNTRLHKKIAFPLLQGPFHGQLVEDIQGFVYKMEKGELGEDEFISCVCDAMQKSAARGELDSWLGQDVRDDENIDITLKKCIGYAPLKRWYLKLHFMAPGNVHGLHGHRDVLSTQVIARGKLHVQEMDLLGNLADNPTKLEIKRDERVEAVSGFVTTDRIRNVHGFEPVEGPAVRFQFYLRGQTRLKARLFPKRGRLYVHPDWESRNGDILFATIGESGKSGES